MVGISYPSTFSVFGAHLAFVSISNTADDILCQWILFSALLGKQQKLSYAPKFTARVKTIKISYLLFPPDLGQDVKWLTPVPLQRYESLFRKYLYTKWLLWNGPAWLGAGVLTGALSWWIETLPHHTCQQTAWGGGSGLALCWALSFYIAEAEWSPHTSLDFGVFRRDPHLRQL